MASSPEQTIFHGFILPSENPSINTDSQHHNHMSRQLLHSKTGYINGGMPLIPSSQSADSNSVVGLYDLAWQRRMISGHDHYLPDASKEKLGNYNSLERRKLGKEFEEDPKWEYGTESSSDHDADDEYDSYGKLSDVEDDADDNKNLLNFEPSDSSLIDTNHGTSSNAKFNAHDEELLEVYCGELDINHNKVDRNGMEIKNMRDRHNANSKYKEKLFCRSKIQWKPLISLEGEKPVSRTWSLTNNDMEELRGSIDLGFGFANSYDQDCPLKATFPALEFYHTVNKNFLESRNCSPISTPREANTTLCGNSSDTYYISSSVDSPSDVKLRLRHWAQAVACSLKEGCFTNVNDENYYT